MGVLCLFVQEQREPKLNLFLHSHHEISQNQAITISDHFAKLISTNTSARGEVFIAKKFRAVFILLNEVYVVTVCHKSDYPYDALRCANNAKLLMFEACKGVEVTVINLYKKFGQIMLALEELINETNTFKPPSTSLEMVGKSKLGEAHHVSAQYNGTSHIQASKTLSSGSSFITSQDTPKKARRGTIKQMEKLISYTADELWKEKQKQMESHQKRFQILDKFQAPISNEQIEDNTMKDDMLPDPTDIINFQFGFDFTAPDEEDALPSFNHKRAKSTNISTGSESNGISSFRKRQMEHIALGQQMFPLSEEEWHSLKVPSLPENLKPVFIPPPTTNLPPLPQSFVTLQPQKLPPKVGTAFDRGDSKLISFEPFDLHGSTTSSKMEGEDTEVDMSDEDYTFRSDKQDKFTDSIYEYNPPKVTTQNSSSNILLPTNLPPLPSTLTNQVSIPNNTGSTIPTNFLDDFLGPTNTQNTSSLLLVDSLMTPPGKSTQPLMIPNNGDTSIPPIPTITPSNITPKGNNINNGENIPSVPPINSIKPASKITTNETSFLTEIQNKQLNPVAQTSSPSTPMFDPNELKRSIEQSQQKRAAVLPFKVLVTETVVKNMSGLTEEEYNFMGQIELILFNHESYRSSDAYKFILSLINDQFNNAENFTKIAKIVCNPKIAKELSNSGDVTSHAFECNVTGQEINPKSQNAVILKYKLKEHLNLVPFKLRPLYFMAIKDGQTMLNISIDYIVNPATPLDKLSFLIRISPTSEQITLKSQSKPEGRWNATRQELLVNVDQPGPKGSVIAKFLLNREVKDMTELQTEFLCKFNAKGLLAGFTVEGGESKRSAHNQVFLGGCEYSITTPSWRYKLTSENLNPQFTNK